MTFTKQQKLRARNFWKKEVNKKLITRELRDIIHGYLLGDGYLTDAGGLQVMQSLQQRNLVEWMYEKLKTLRTNTPIHDQKILDKRSNTYTYSARFTTRALLKGFRAMWYIPDPIKRAETGENRFTKVLPKSINAIMNPTVLTLWFAGDGTKIEGGAAKIEVTNFTVEERLRLQLVLKQKLGLNTSINKAGVSSTGTPQYTINFNTNAYLKFREYTSKYNLIKRLFPHKLCSLE